jgi:hypothetical protein
LITVATETDTTSSRWNVDTLKEFFSTQLNDFKLQQTEIREADDLRYRQRFDAQQKAVVDALLAAEKAVNAALASADRAVVKAETASEKRFESVNEFRAVLISQSASLMPRTEVDGRLAAVNEKIDDIKTRIDRGEGGRGQQAASQTTMIAVAGVVAAFFGIAVGYFAHASPGHDPIWAVPAPVIPVAPK